MKQILIIFRKDCRRFWPEILVSIALTAAFVWVTPHQWLPAEAQGNHPFGFMDLRHVEILANTLTALVPLSWLVLITRVVHDENLASERSFWVTRPYRWPLLLIAKTIFIGTFILIPLLVSQIVLLTLGGFNPRLHVGGLGFTVLIFGTAILPMFALATVVSSLLRLILTLVVALGMLVGAAFVATSFDSPSTVVPAGDALINTLLVVVLVAVIVVQYSARRLWLSRSLLLTMIATIILLVSGPFDATAIEHVYQRSDSSLVVGYSPSEDQPLGVVPKNDKRVTLEIPIGISGQPEDRALIPDDVRVTLIAPDGTRWRSPWQASYNIHLLEAQPGARLSVDVDRAFAERVQSRPLSLRVEIAFTELAASAPVQTMFPYLERRTRVLGICAGRKPGRYRDVEMFCRMPLHQPLTSQVTVPLFSDPCDKVTSVSQATGSVTGWTGVLEPEPSGLDLSPVTTTSIVLTGAPGTRTEDGEHTIVCAGSPMAVRSYRLLRRFRYEFSVPDVKLPKAGWSE